MILQKGSRPRGRGRGGGGGGWGGERRAEHGGRLTAVCAFQGFGPRGARGGEQVLSKPGLVHPLLLLSLLLPSERLLQWLLSLSLQGLPPSILAQLDGLCSQLDGLCSESSLGAEYPMPRLVSQGTRLLRILHRRNACRRLSIEMSGGC